MPLRYSKKLEQQPDGEMDKNDGRGTAPLEIRPRIEVKIEKH